MERVKGKQHLLPHNIKGCLEDYQVGKRGKRMEIFGKKIKVLTNGGGEEFKFVGNYIHP